jgi:hypothetical protein
MSNGPTFPVLVLETETGDLTLFRTAESLRAMVEEFWDILRNDFVFWDADGFRLRFGPSFLDGDDGAVTRSSTAELDTLVSHVRAFARRNGFEWVAEVNGTNWVALFRDELR